MCLDRRIPLNDMRDIINLIPKEGKIVYKVVGVATGKYYPLVSNTKTPFGVGSYAADTSETLLTGWGGNYKAGFHFFQVREGAEKLLNLVRERFENTKKNRRVHADMRNKNELVRSRYKIIECRIKKSWVTAMGIDGVDGEDITVVTKKAIFPNPKDTL